MPQTGMSKRPHIVQDCVSIQVKAGCYGADFLGPEGALCVYVGDLHCSQHHGPSLQRPVSCQYIVNKQTGDALSTIEASG